MPFRSLRVSVRAGEPVKIFTAKPGDVEIQIRSRAFGGVQASSGFTFTIGGPELSDGKPLDEGAEGVGLSCFSGEWQSTIEPGDEVWADAEASDFQDYTPLTLLVRSTGSRATGRGVGGSAGSADRGTGGGGGSVAGGSPKGATGGRGPAPRPRVG